MDSERLLALLGDRGTALLDAIHELEVAAEDGGVSYVSLIARRRR